jgi:lipopolysaccharide biosynthesis regulator YciM
MTLMKKALAFVLGVATVLLFVYVVWLNPTRVEFHVTGDQSFSLLLGLLLVVTFLLGVFVTVLVVALLRAGRSIRHWPERQQEKQATRIAEWEHAGNDLAWEGELQRARSLLQKARRRQPNNTNASLALASSYIDTGEYESAQRILNQAVAQDAGDADLRFALGEAVRRSGDAAEAIRILESVRVQYPRAPRALKALRSLYRDCERWQEAAEVQEAYLRSVPSGEPADKERRLLAQFQYQAAMATKDPSARADALSAILRADRGFVPAAVSLGDALVATDRADEAMKLWDRTFRSVPQTVLIERMFSQQSSPKERERTLALMKKYETQLGADSVRVTAARANLENGDVSACATELEAISRQSAPAVQTLWAEVHRRRNEPDHALKAFENAVEGSSACLDGYLCTNCGRVAGVWTGYCTGCRECDTYRPLIDAPEQD